MKGYYSHHRDLAACKRVTLAVTAGLLVLLPAGFRTSTTSAGDDVIERLSILTGSAAPDFASITPDNPALTDGRVDIGPCLPELHQGFRHHVWDQKRWADQLFEHARGLSEQLSQDREQQVRFAEARSPELENLLERDRESVDELVRRILDVPGDADVHFGHGRRFADQLLDDIDQGFESAAAGADVYVEDGRKFAEEILDDINRGFESPVGDADVIDWGVVGQLLDDIRASGIR
jgi:hypothetical protein